MIKFLTGIILLSLPCTWVLAQTASSGGADLFGAGSLNAESASPTPAAEKKPGDGKAVAAASPLPPTVIDSENMTYDGKARISIFTGDDYGVLLKDPRFTVFCDKLTAYMRKDSGPAPSIPGKKPRIAPTPTPTPTPTPAGSPKGKGGAADPTAGHSNALQRAVAEGTADEPVVIVQDKPAANGQAAQHNVGIALKADYDADSGNVVLTGWPRVTQGMNTQIATSPGTVMIMNRDSNTMTTKGPSRSVIREESQAKKSGTGSDASDSSPSPSAQ